jgi:hypothetical protein
MHIPGCFWRPSGAARPTRERNANTAWLGVPCRKLSAQQILNYPTGSESGREVGDGAGKRLMECEMCTENEEEGMGWERQWR